MESAAGERNDLQLSDHSIHYLINHVFLPSQLPTMDDHRVETDHDLLRAVLQALRNFKSSVGDEVHEAIGSASNMLQGTLNIHDSVNGTFAISCTITLHIYAQNAGMIISKSTKVANIEMFELSPLNNDVMSTEGRLRRLFPGSAVSIPFDVFESPEFQETVAKTLAKMSYQAAVHTLPQVKKNGRWHDETRDTVHPKMITELFAAFLTSVGSPAEVSYIWKNTREEVCWQDSLLPWRRSPLWLLIRVTLQLHFQRSEPTSETYKSFMLFFMASILDQSHGSQISSSLHYIMTAKVSRRSLKLALPLPIKISSFIQSTLAKTAALLKKQWILVEDQTLTLNNPTNLKSLSIRQDIVTTLPFLDTHIDSIMSREKNNRFTVFRRTCELSIYDARALPKLVKGENMMYKLAAIESWVASCLDEWLSLYQSQNDTCTSLRQLLESYHTAAVNYYRCDPESSSLMILTTLELWVACDKSAVHICGLLKEYNHGIPQDLLQCLNLHRKVHMERLRAVEKYLTGRAKHARFLSNYVLANFGNEHSFPARYFTQSSIHQRLMEDIEKKAAEDRQAKCNELEQKRGLYGLLMQSYATSKCEYYNQYNAQTNSHKRIHRRECWRCQARFRAENLNIAAYEWPLPSRACEARTTVFELRPPAFFTQWRDITLYILVDVMGMASSATEKPDVPYTPQSYEGLLQWAQGYNTSQRVVALSTNKPHTATHRRLKDIITTATERDVCLQNGLRFRYLDNRTGSHLDNTRGFFINEFKTTDMVPTLCTYTLPADVSSLQWLIWRMPTSPSGPSANTAIALQAQCPVKLSIGEYRALASIAFGYKIQWHNILVQLVSPTIDFNREETELIIRQCIFQAGPCIGGEITRDSNTALGDPGLAESLIISIFDAIQRVKENWQSCQALSIFISLATRILSLAPTENIKATCLGTLSSARRISLSWINDLKYQVQQTDNNDLGDELQLKAAHIALICAGTFDVDDEYLCGTLAFPEQASVLIQCSIVIQESLDKIPKSPGSLSHLLHQRWERLAYRSFSMLVLEIVEKKSAALDDAIKSVWPAHHPGGEWKMLKKPYHHWLTTQIESTEDGCPLTIHFSTLTGQLLYRKDPLYLPLSVAGMRFSSKRDFAGHRLNFGLHLVKKRLMVQATTENQIFELIPPQILAPFFPVTFVENYIHWYNTSGDYVEFCAKENPWNHSDDNWKLTRTGDNCSWQLRRAGSSVIFNSLEDSEWIHIILHESSSLDIELPRLHLGFHLEQGGTSIRSRQFRGMLVDEDHKLVLKDENGQLRRKVMIPNGIVTHYQNEGHVKVTIDNLLCRLVDDSSLQSKLLLSYLHSLTSFCLPDPLTQRTGTEQALTILRSAAVQSHDCFTQENIDILKHIAELAPERSYYPENKKVMQYVHWSQQLSFLTQRGDFFRVKFFSDSCVTLAELPKVDLKLLHRDELRSSTVQVSGYGAENHATQYDTVYSARDRGQNSSQGSRAFAMSKLVFKENFSLLSPTQNVFLKHIWGYLSKGGVVRGPFYQLPDSLFVYDARLFIEAPSLISAFWIHIHRALSRQSSRPDKFQAMLWLATLAFAEDADMIVIQSLAAFFAVSEMANIRPPTGEYSNLGDGYVPNSSWISSTARTADRPMQECPEMELSQEPGEDHTTFHKRRNQQWLKNRRDAITTLVHQLESQWPCQIPIRSHLTDLIRCNRYIKVDEIWVRIEEKFKRWFNNYQLCKYLEQIIQTMPHHILPASMPSYSPINPEWNLNRKCGYISVNDVFRCPAPKVELSNVAIHSVNLEMANHRPPPDLPTLLSKIRGRASAAYQKEYTADLSHSLQSLHNRRKEYTLTTSTEDLKIHFHELQEAWEATVKNIYSRMVQAVTQAERARGRIQDSNLTQGPQHWPRLCPSFFLECLSRQWWEKLPEDWKSCIVQYGTAITELQRAARLVRAIHYPPALISEWLNTGHTNWEPRKYPESLLLEIESDIMIRPVQEEIAAKMRTPDSQENTVMQLNMGEGKSSVIVPIVAAALATGSRLVRVVVAKAQSRQMHQMLVSKLGGLLNRRVYRMPFSRAMDIQLSQASAIRSLFEQCMESGGIMLVQPEHILSFKLMGLESMLTGKENIGRALLQGQQYLNTHSRDIVDESDENFSVKFELVYTMGTQQRLEHSPERWMQIHKVLEVMRKVILKVQSEFPGFVEVNSMSPGSFPRTRFLRPDAQKVILSRAVQHICSTGLHGFQIVRQSRKIRQGVWKYITKAELTTAEISRVENPRGAGIGVSQTLLLLRGLVAGGVLAFAFGQMRWRVDYGLDPSRRPETQLAVPYRAKDNPSPRSEFSHPDVVCVLTSLSYYYGGLDDESILTAFEHLVRSEQAQVEYQVWVRDTENLPDAFKLLEGVNLENRFQCKFHVFPHFRYAKGIIDYFLEHIVFPREIMEFPSKLATSGWDIGEIKSHPTTGFSGTNDSSKVLPLHVKQLNLETQNHTNALVLEHLLQPENTVALVPHRQEADESDAEMLLKLVTAMDPPTRVILDVGAQILELDNVSFAREWLGRDPDVARTQAAIFVDDNDELCVLDRRGHIEPLQTSPFATQLDVCIVFLDEAHTRGTDLKLPRDYRAAVTLGANLTKDRLVQACMRMRMLGKGQSVVFCVPEEIQAKIQAQTPNSQASSRSSISVADILVWSVTETWQDVQRNMPLWAAQGRRHQKHAAIWAKAWSGKEVNLDERQAKGFLEREAKTLEARYRPTPIPNQAGPSRATEGNTSDPIAIRCREFANLKLDVAGLAEQREQEQELSPETEREREVQKPAYLIPAVHQMHVDVLDFVSSGDIKKAAVGYGPAFASLKQTSVASLYDLSRLGAGLLVSRDFAQTVAARANSRELDLFQRPVQWILTGSPNANETTIKYMMIISPFEAQHVLPTVQKSEKVSLHLYAPRTNLGFRALDSLDLYVEPERFRLQPRKMPRNLIVELNLFAGQLYLSSYDEYVEVCKFLGLTHGRAREGEVIGTDGFILRDHAGNVGGESGLERSPVEFFKLFFTKIRRNGGNIDKTHMGRILDNEILTPEDFKEN
ncbi:hypothetical protein F5B20DRAFT_594387 [Whalleya microplaca]|nr:hypothetical protein F5B20DRAFT_594387 [Whalleya microplaca]